MAHLVGLLLALGGCTAKAPSLPAGDPARPDIVLLSVDSLRPDHLGAYGYARPTSPALDALAARGLRFTNARAASPWTLPSHLTMLTGRWPTEHLVVDDVLALSPNVPMIQERLAAAGWATAGITSTVYVSKLFGFARGFDHWNDGGITEKDNLDHPVHLDAQVDEALTWARSLPAGKPAFLFLHSYDAHYPYLPPSPWNTTFDPARSTKEVRYRTWAWYKQHPLSPEALQLQVDQYDECIAWLDAAVGRLVAGWDRPVTFLVVADHGEELGDHGSWGHAHTLYPEVMDIPLLMAGPGIPTGVRDDRVGTIDLAATIAALAGVEGLGGDGRDLRAPVPPRPFYEETSRFKTRRLSISEGSLRLDLDLSRGDAALYDHAADPGEHTDVAASRPDEVDRLSRAVFTHLGTPWSWVQGRLWTNGIVVRDGAREPQPAPPGDIAIWPPTADLMVEGGPRRRVILTPDLPGTLAFRGPRPAVDVTVGADVRAQLEALGYVQGDDE